MNLGALFNTKTTKSNFFKSDAEVLLAKMALHRILEPFVQEHFTMKSLEAKHVYAALRHLVEKKDDYHINILLNKPILAELGLDASSLRQEVQRLKLAQTQAQLQATQPAHEDARLDNPHLTLVKPKRMPLTVQYEYSLEQSSSEDAEEVEPAPHVQHDYVERARDIASGLDQYEESSSESTISVKIK